MGELAPDFELPDGDGNMRSLYALLSERPYLVLFYRGAWCPACRIQLKEFASLARGFTDLGVGIAAISSDSTKRMASFQRELQLPFVMLSDARRQVISDWGILNPFEGRVAYPATLLVDTTRQVALAEYEDAYIRTRPRQVLDFVGQWERNEMPQRPGRRVIVPGPIGTLRAIVHMVTAPVAAVVSSAKQWHRGKVP